jgi:hypothetical protein
MSAIAISSRSFLFFSRRETVRHSGQRGLQVKLSGETPPLRKMTNSPAQ